MLRYAITNLGCYGHDFERARNHLRMQAERWIGEGVDFVQVREKQLSAVEVLALAEDLTQLAAGSATKILVNSRADIAAAAGAHGVHLTSDPDALQPAEVGTVYAAAGLRRPIVSCSCHSLAEVQRAAQCRADLILFGPVFEKRVDGRRIRDGEGLDRLREAVAVAGATRVLALGGVAAERVEACLQVGAAGVAAIRLFAVPEAQAGGRPE